MKHSRSIAGMPKIISVSYTHLIRNPFNDFIDDIIARLDVNAIRERGLRLLFDPMHGSGTYPALVIFYTTRCTPDIINDNKDAYFGGAMPAPSEKDLSDLSLQVVRGDYDLGIALDGDGDRLGIIDSNGRYIGANEILVMLYYYLHEYKGWKLSLIHISTPRSLTIILFISLFLIIEYNQ